MREFSERHHRSPTVAELCERMSLTEEEVLDALHAGRAASASSLDAPVAKQDDSTVSLGEGLGRDAAGRAAELSRTRLPIGA